MSFDVDRSVTSQTDTDTDTQTHRHGQTHEHGFGEGSYTIAPKGAKNRCKLSGNDLIFLS